MRYVFPGMSPFLHAAAEQTTVEAPHMVKCEKIWHVGQIQDALGQVPRLQPEDREALFHHCQMLRNSLAAVLSGVDTAISEVKAACALQDEPAPTPDERITHFQHVAGRKRETRVANPAIASVD